MINKKIILCFDGPDNVGKGTQINLVREYFKKIPFVILHVTNPIGDTAEKKVEYGSAMENQYFKARKSLSENFIPQINDRAHYSEYAYRIFRDSDRIDDILEMENKFKELIVNTLIFTFIDKPENISLRDDGLSMYEKEDVDKIQKLIDRFKYISEKSIFDNYIINIDGKNEDEVFEIVLEKIKNKFNL